MNMGPGDRWSKLLKGRGDERTEGKCPERLGGEKATGDPGNTYLVKGY